jgi:hypothetical protein
MISMPGIEVVVRLPLDMSDRRRLTVLVLAAAAVPCP